MTATFSGPGHGRTRVGVISDTHGLLRLEAVRALDGSELIIHAGDVGRVEVLEELAGVARLVAVRGNIDDGGWAEKLPLGENVRVGGVSILVLHDLVQLQGDPRELGHDVVITGHTHRPRVYRQDGVLYVNPGSAGPRRFKLPVSVAFMDIEGAEVTAHIHELPVAKPDFG